MQGNNSVTRAVLMATVATSLLAVSNGSSLAGGFYVREQSTSGLGSAFAGAAAGYDLSSSFWNPAAFGIAGDGLTTESHYSLILPFSEITAETNNPFFPGSDTTEIDKWAALSGSYGAYRLNDQLVLGLSINSPIGLSTEPEDNQWQGRVHGRRATILTVNATPTLTYEVAPGVHIGAGVQLEYMRLKFLFASGGAPGAPSAAIDVKDDVGVGATAGILLQPNAGTSIGLGWRSSVEHDLSGVLEIPSGQGVPGTAIDATFETPDIATLSIRQDLMPGWRALGTVEWSNWSRFDSVPINGTPLVLDANWEDGWLFSAGLEHDYSDVLTLRGGVGYEISPIREASQRLPQIPDSDRVWLSLGATYKYSASTTVDIAYAHIFFDDAPIEREALSTPGFILSGEADNSADILSASIKTRW